ncbi:MAG: sulfurtransferase TusA family protein [Rhizobiales bacterium]|nr:sulfurtransferase TusA family protein [Hyphomicrobiales bacterium]
MAATLTWAAAKCPVSPPGASCRAEPMVDDAPMTEKSVSLRGLKCPLPALKTRKLLAGLAAGDTLTIECTDPLAAIDIPNLLRETGDTLDSSAKDGGVLTFTIRKR